VRLFRQISVLITQADDGTGLKFLDAQGTAAIARASAAATFIKKQNVGNLDLAASGVEAIPFGDVTTAKAILLETDRALTIVFNGGADILRLEPDVTASPAEKGVLYWEGNFTGLVVTNTDALNEANVLYAIIGV